MTQSSVNTFNLFSPEVPLTGRCLIEASAGTGKTYTITGMVVRLVAENVHGAGDDLSNILVVTFTKAATQELKDRIIKRLRECRSVLQHGEQSTKDPFLTSFHQLYKDDGKALKYIQRALHQIDDLSVFTIHSFAQRVIQQYGPRAGVDMNDEIITDKQEITSELIYDYWRQTLARAEGNLASKAMLKILMDDSSTPDKFAGRYSNIISDSTVPLDADLKISDWEEELTAKQQVFEELLSDLPDVADKLGTLFSGAFKLSKSYFKEQKWRDVEGSLYALGDLEYFFELDDDQVKTLKYLGYQNIQEKFNKGCSYDQLSLDAATIRWMKHWQTVFDNYQEFRSASSNVLMHILKELQVRYFNQLEQRRAYTYDDILYTANKLIQDVAEIREAVRSAFPIGLIDEFQDTDPLQWQLFNTLYDEKYADQTLLYLIGDPKQSIYKFRGADINAYLLARESIQQQRIFTLDTNYRSDKGFIQALNRLWEHSNQPFYTRGISYQPTKPAHGNRSPLNTSWAPLHWIIDEFEEDFLNKHEAENRAATIAARSISNLLKQNQSAIGSGVFRAEDVAVLCNTNRQSSLMKEALFEVGLQSVLVNRESVYESDEASDLLRVLEAVADPANHARIRAALGTRILYKKELLLELGNAQSGGDQTQKAFEMWLLRFREWHKAWDDQGVTPMLRTLLKECSAREHLISYANGERRLTNLNHLMELLGDIEKRRPGEIFYLLEQLRKHIHDTETANYQPDSEEEELRLESDRNLVKIVTIHRSKGLEYKVVVLPFLWDGINASGISGKAPFVYHNPDDSSAKRVDLDGGTYEDTKYRYFEEEFADQLRVTYVALTRGVHQNILIHVPFASNYKDKGNSAYSAIDYVLTGRERYQKALRKKFASHIDAEETRWITYPEITQTIQKVARQSAGTISFEIWDNDSSVGAVEKPTVTDDITIPQIKKFTKQQQLQPAWSITSYSSLTRYSSDEDELVDFPAEKIDDPENNGEEDELAAPEVHQPKKSIFTFPKGAQTGLCWHRIFELIPFHQPKEWKKIITEELASHEFDTRMWDEITLNMVNRAMFKTLNPLEENELRLANLQPESLLKEMAFHFRFDRADSEAMVSIIRQSRASAHHQSELFRGVMKGFIDLTFCHNDTFYILDYKSNHLGNHVEDYYQPALEQSVHESIYDLQYHIYALALHRYLKEKMGRTYTYETHFGGVFYLYLRGIQPGDGSDQTGIYFNRPHYHVINALNSYLNND